MNLELAQQRTVAFCLMTAFALAGCADECREYSDFSCKQIERASYNVYFYYPSGTEEYLGRADGLSHCGSVAHSFAASKKLQGNRDWGYVCCMRARGSECYEKHR
jgi:hypothetical protein